MKPVDGYPALPRPCMQGRTERGMDHQYRESETTKGKKTRRDMQD